MPRLFSHRLTHWLIIVIGLGGIVVLALTLKRQAEWAKSRSELVVVVKPDGSFYFQADPMVPVTADTLHARWDTANPPHCVIALDGSLPAKLLAPVVMIAAEAGFHRYQIRTPEHRLNVSLQGCLSCQHSESVEQWLDLRADALDPVVNAPDRPEQSDGILAHAEVIVLADSDLPVNALIQAAIPHAIPGRSMEFNLASRYPDGETDLETIQFYRRDDFEDQAHRYMPPPPGPVVAWLGKWWKATKDTVDSWF